MEQKLQDVDIPAVAFILVEEEQCVSIDITVLNYSLLMCI